MRRSLIVTVAATVAMVLLAMLVPMAVLVRSYAVEDRLSRASLEVQATETVVSGQDKGAVSVYVARINRADPAVVTTVLYPDGTAVGPEAQLGTVDQARVRDARSTGRARVDDVSGGSAILVPVSLGGNSTVPAQTPVIRVSVRESGVSMEVHRAWLILAALGLVLLGGAVLLADRLGRSFVQPIRQLADSAQSMGEPGFPGRAPVQGPAEVRAASEALNRLIARVEVLLERERESVADLSHRLRTPITALRLGIDGVPDSDDRRRLGGDVDRLEQMVDHVVREARRSTREGLVPEADAAAVVAERVAFWTPLAEDQQRRVDVDVEPGPLPVAAGEEDLAVLVDTLLDNVFTHTPDGAAVSVTLAARDGGGAVLVVGDAGPGFRDGVNPLARGASGAGSTGLGLSIVAATARQSGGAVRTGRSRLGGAEVTVDLGAPGG